MTFSRAFPIVGEAPLFFREGSTMGSRRRMSPWRLVFVAFIVILASSVAAQEAAAPGAGEEAAAEANPRIAIELKDGGRIVIELYPDEAPVTCDRIVALVREGFYDGSEFHRVESYLVQAGRKECDLAPIEGEMFSQGIWHEPGAVGIARLPHDYDSAVAQFYIMKEEKPAFNGEYALFGKVVEGMEVVRELEKGRKIERVTLLGP